jgi:tetratricopeptide (TPR) repeat protein
MRCVGAPIEVAIAWYRLSQLAYFSGAALGRVTEFAAAAERHSGQLPWRERRLIGANWAYARGAARESDQAYREILRTYPSDVEALFGLAYLHSQYGWLLGGPQTSYREPMERFLGYEPNDFSGLMYLAIVEAQSGNCATSDSLYRALFPSGGPYYDGVAIFCTKEFERQDEMIQAARMWPIGLVRLIEFRVNRLAQNPRGAAEFARILDERDPSSEGRALARLHLAELDLALGRREAARGQFTRLATVNPAWALADGVYRMLTPYHAVSDEALRAWQDSLRNWDAGSIPPVVPPTQGWDALLFTRHDGLHEHLRAYLLGRIASRLGDFQASLRYADDLERFPTPPDVGSLTRDLAQSIRAHVLHEQGRLAEALRALEAAPREVPFSRLGQGWAFVQPQERFLRAELLYQLGRHEEALWWYQSVGYWPESVMAGPSHLRQGQVLERLGRRDEAAEPYVRFLDLWREADVEFRPMIEEAERALQRLGQEPRPRSSRDVPR